MTIITCNKNEIKINSYIIKHNGNLIIIDPYDFEELEDCIEEGESVDYIVLTHEHFDHIKATDKLRQKYGAKVIAQKHASVNITSPKKNLSKFSEIILESMSVKTKKAVEEISIGLADIEFEDEYRLLWHEYTFFFKHTPGHSKGSSCVLVGKYLFVGDSLFECCKSNVKGPGASKKEYLEKTIPFFNTLDLDLKVFSGHYQSFILDDKINAKQKAIENYKKRIKFTNCYVSYNGFLELLEKCFILVREDSVFLLKKEEGFCRFYYFVSDMEKLNNLRYFFEKNCSENIVLEYISKEGISDKLYENIHFLHYKTYSRYISVKKNRYFDSVVLAQIEDLPTIKQSIDNTFDPLSDYIPSETELRKLIEKQEVYIIKVDGDIAGVSIYQQQGRNYYFRLSCVFEKYRNGFIGYMLASSSPKKAEKLSAWVDDENNVAKKLNIHLGYKKDGLRNYIFVFRPT